MVDDDAPTVQIPATPRQPRWPAVVTGLSLVAIAVVGVAVFLLWPSDAVAPVSAAGPAVAVAPPPAAATGPITTTPAAAVGGCPAATSLVAAYRQSGTSPGRAGAEAKSTVTCAGGFAVVKLHSPGDSENVSAIFAVGPPVRFLEAGSGPICTDDAASLPGSVLVPRSAAAALNCVTTADSSSSAPTSAAPTLGSVWASNQRGFGDIRPVEVNAGGDSTGVVENITWSAWGGATARGTGTGNWIGPTQSSSESTPAPAVLVVDRLGTCEGHPAYLRVRWYFPTHGETAPAPNAGFASICGT